jgi:ferrous iron transport protein A
MEDVLSNAGPGDEFEIETVPDETVRAQLLRLGFFDGSVECRRRVRNGPVIVRRNGTELAIGASLADRITIHLA